MIDYLLKNPKIKISKNTLDYFENVNKYIREFYELFYDFNVTKLNSISKDRYELIKKGYQIYEKSDNKEGVIIFHLILMTQVIFDLVGPVYCLNIEESNSKVH